MMYHHHQVNAHDTLGLHSPVRHQSLFLVSLLLLLLLRLLEVLLQLSIRQPYCVLFLRTPLLY